MALLTASIRTILENGGLVEFASNVASGLPPITTGVNDTIVDCNYTKVNLTVSPGDNKIRMTRNANTVTDNNGVNIRTIDDYATIGTITTPGYIFTGDFSGCVFYLYKTGPNQVTGIHAYSGLKSVTTRTGIFRRKVINQVVRESSPVDYYTRNPAMMICRYPTRGELDVQNGEVSLAFLSCVEQTTATTFLFGVSRSEEGSRVRRLLKTYHVKF